MLVKSRRGYKKITVISRVSQLYNNLTCKNGNNTHIDGEKNKTL